MKKSLFIICLILISCNAYKNIPVQTLTVGMSTETVQAIVKKPMVKVSFEEKDGEMLEVYQVQKRIVRGGIARQERYTLFFRDGKLVKYEKDSEKFSF